MHNSKRVLSKPRLGPRLELRAAGPISGAVHLVPAQKIDNGREPMIRRASRLVLKPALAVREFCRFGCGLPVGQAVVLVVGITAATEMALYVICGNLRRNVTAR